MRRGIVALGILLIICAFIIWGVFTVTITFHAQEFTGFFGEDRATDPIFLPGGSEITISWETDDIIQVSIASEKDWIAYENGYTDTLEVLDMGSGSSGTISTTIPEDGKYVIVVGGGTMFTNGYIEIEYNPYGGYAWTALIVGGIILIIGLLLPSKKKEITQPQTIIIQQSMQPPSNEQRPQ